MASIRPATNPGRGLSWLPIFALTLLSAGIRLYGLGGNGLWDGEPFTLLFAQRRWGDFLHYVADFSAHPPLWFALTKLLIPSGWNEWVIRFPAAVAGVLCVPTLYVLGKHLFGARVGFMAAFLMAISPICVLYSQNARMYTTYALLSQLLIYALWRAVHEGQARWWAALTLVAALGMYTHYLFLLPLGGALLFAAATIIGRARQASDGLMHARQFGQNLLVHGRGLLASVLALALLYLPWIRPFVSAFILRQLGMEEVTEQLPPLGAMLRLLMDLSGNQNWGLVFFALAAGLGLVWLWRTRRNQHLLLFVLTILVPSGAFVLLEPRRLPVRYLIFVLPAYLLLIALACSEPIPLWIARILSRAWSRYSPQFTRLAWLVMFAVLALANLPNLPYGKVERDIFSEKADEGNAIWRTLTQAAKDGAQPGDVLILPSVTASARMVVAYFDPRFLARLYNTAPTHSDHVTVWSVADRKSQLPVTRQAKFRELTLQNPGFESGLSPWTSPAGVVAVALDDAVRAEGGFALRTTMSKPGDAVMTGESFPVTSGQLLRATILTKHPVEGFYTLSPQLGVVFLGKDKRAITTVYHVSARPALLVESREFPGWQMQVVEGPAPAEAEAAQLTITFRGYAYGWARTSWLDQLRVFVEEAPAE